MRHVLGIGALGSLVLLAGCNASKWNLVRGREDSRPTTEVPTAAQLVYYINDNADRVKSLRCNDVGLQCSQGLRTVGLTGRMVCQKPRNFRMSAKLMGQDELDLGSNDQEFWFWVKHGQPYQFH